MKRQSTTFLMTALLLVAAAPRLAPARNVDLSTAPTSSMLYGKKYDGADPQLIEGDNFRMIISIPEFGENPAKPVRIVPTPACHPACHPVSHSAGTPHVESLLRQCVDLMIRSQLQQSFIHGTVRTRPFDAAACPDATLNDLSRTATMRPTPPFGSCSLPTGWKSGTPAGCRRRSHPRRCGFRRFRVCGGGKIVWVWM